MGKKRSAKYPFLKGVKIEVMLFKNCKKRSENIIKNVKVTSLSYIKWISMWLFYKIWKLKWISYKYGIEKKYHTLPVIAASSNCVYAQKNLALAIEAYHVTRIFIRLSNYGQALYTNQKACIGGIWCLNGMILQTSIASWRMTAPNLGLFAVFFFLPFSDYFLRHVLELDSYLWFNLLEHQV